MNLKRPSWMLVASVLAAMSMACPSAWAQNVVVVTSSDSQAYQEALAGLKEVYPQPIQQVSLSHDEFDAPPSGSIVVAFGGKAAVQAASSYNGMIIYGLAPVTDIPSEQRSAPLVKILTSPTWPVIIQKYKELQPGLHRLGVLWMSDSFADSFLQKKQIKSAIDVELVSVRLNTLDDLPSQLRNLQGKVDAIWMPPDPALVTPESFATVREFCLAQRIAFYVPSDGLVAKGATAAVYSSFRDLGRLAGSLLAKATSGNAVGTLLVFPDKASLAVNVNAAAAIGLKIAPDVLQKADKVIKP